MEASPTMNRASSGRSQLRRTYNTGENRSPQTKGINNMRTGTSSSNHYQSPIKKKLAAMAAASANNGGNHHECDQSSSCGSTYTSDTANTTASESSIVVGGLGTIEDGLSRMKARQQQRLQRGDTRRCRAGTLSRSPSVSRLSSPTTSPGSGAGSGEQVDAGHPSTPPFTPAVKKPLSSRDKELFSGVDSAKQSFGNGLGLRRQSSQKTLGRQSSQKTLRCGGDDNDDDDGFGAIIFPSTPFGNEDEDQLASYSSPKKSRNHVVKKVCLSPRKHSKQGQSGGEDVSPTKRKVKVSAKELQAMGVTVEELTRRLKDSKSSEAPQNNILDSPRKVVRKVRASKDVDETDKSSKSVAKRSSCGGNVASSSRAESRKSRGRSRSRARKGKTGESDQSDQSGSTGETTSTPTKRTPRSRSSASSKSRATARSKSRARSLTSSKSRSTSSDSGGSSGSISPNTKASERTEPSCGDDGETGNGVATIKRLLVDALSQSLHAEPTTTASARETAPTLQPPEGDSKKKERKRRVAQPRAKSLVNRPSATRAPIPTPQTPLPPEEGTKKKERTRRVAQPPRAKSLANRPFSTTSLLPAEDAGNTNTRKSVADLVGELNSFSSHDRRSRSRAPNMLKNNSSSSFDRDGPSLDSNTYHGPSRTGGSVSKLPNNSLFLPGCKSSSSPLVDDIDDSENKDDDDIDFGFGPASFSAGLTMPTISRAKSSPLASELAATNSASEKRSNSFQMNELHGSSSHKRRSRSQTPSKPLSPGASFSSSSGDGLDANALHGSNSVTTKLSMSRSPTSSLFISGCKASSSSLMDDTDNEDDDNFGFKSDADAFADAFPMPTMNRSQTCPLGTANVNDGDDSDDDFDGVGFEGDDDEEDMIEATTLRTSKSLGTRSGIRERKTKVRSRSIVQNTKPTSQP